MVSSAYLRLLIFLPEILIPAWTSSSLAFLMMYYACKLNKQGNNIQLWRIPFPILNQSSVPCPILTVASRLAYRFSQETGKMVWYSHFFKNISQFVVIHTVKRFSVVNETEFPCFLCNPLNAGNLISDSSAFSKPSLYIWKFSVHVLLKPSLKDFEHNLY